MEIKLYKKDVLWHVDPVEAYPSYWEVRPKGFEDLLFPNLTYDLTIKDTRLYLLSAYDEKNEAQIEPFDLEKIAFHLGIRIIC